MAKYTKKLDVKGVLSFDEGFVYETKKVGKEEVIIAVPFFELLEDFHNETVTISVTRVKEYGEDEDEEYVDAEEDV